MKDVCWPFVFDPQDLETRSENTDVLFASCLITLGPFWSFSQQLDVKADVEREALSLSPGVPFPTQGLLSQPRGAEAAAPPLSR